MLKELGEPLVNAAFDELLSSDIPSKAAKKILTKFRKKWKDYARPALMILICEAVGGNPKLVEPVAKAMILTGGAFDIHDDIIDKSYERTDKRKKTLLASYGPDAMLLAGDALLIGAFSYLPSMHGSLSHEKVMRIAECIKNGLFELGSAELEELKFVHNFNVTPEQYLHTVRMKAADVESYTKIGAIIGNADDKDTESFAKFGRLLGIITILRDDIEDTFNDKFELTSRITKESLPLPIIFSLKDPSLIPLLQTITPAPSDKVLDRILEIVEKNQGFEQTKAIIEAYIIEIRNTINCIKGTEKILSLLT